MDGRLVRLPRDIIFHILSRLPTKSVAICRPACKTLNAIISDPLFSAVPLSNANSGIIMHLKHNNRLYFVEGGEEQEGRENVVKATRLKYPFKMKGLLTHEESPLILGSCNGLLCYAVCVTRHGISRLVNPIHIFNPLTGKYWRLPDFGYCSNIDSCVCGFGFDSCIQSFKVVLVQFYENLDQQIDNEVLIHVLGTSEWRKAICDAPIRLTDTYCTAPPVLVNGALHWVVKDSIESNSCLIRPLILSFDLASESFGVVPVPESLVYLRESKNDVKHDSLGVLGGCLSLAGCISASDMEVWVMKNYKDRDSWIKQYTIRCDHFQNRTVVLPLFLEINGEIVFISKSDTVDSYNTATGECKTWQFDGIQELYTVSCKAIPFAGSFASH